MSSRPGILLRIAVLTMISSSGINCGLRVGEPAPQDPEPRISSDVSCFANLAESVDRFTRGELEDAEIERVTSCAQGAFRGFARLRGADRNSFSPDEIRFFIEKNFPKVPKISDEFLAELMQLKKMIVGGSEKIVSRRDLTAGVIFIEFLKVQALKLNPYMDIYNFNRWRLSSLSEVDQLERTRAAVDNLQEVGRNVGSYLRNSSGPYSITHLEKFIVEIRQFLDWQKNHSRTAIPVESWGKLFRVVRSVALGQVDRTQRGIKLLDVIEPKHWPSIFEGLAGWYGVIIHADRLANGQSMLDGVGLESTVRTFDMATRWVHFSIDSQPDQLLRFAQMDELLDVLEELNWMPKVAGPNDTRIQISSRALKGVLRPLFTKIFGDPKVAWKERRANGLNRFIWSQVIAEVSRWADIQRMISRSKGFSVRESGVSDLGSVQARNMRLMTTAESLDPLSLAAQTVREIQTRMRPFFRSDSRRVHLGEMGDLERLGVTHSFANLSWMNGFRAFSMLLGRGYSSIPIGPGPFAGGISDDELQAWYEDFRDFGVELKLMDPRSSTGGIRTFSEANLFTFTGNGIYRMNSEEAKKSPVKVRLDLAEGMEILSLMFSSGEISRSLYSVLMNERDGVCYKDSHRAFVRDGLKRDEIMSIHGFERIDRECFDREVVDKLDHIVDPLPRLKEYRKTMNAASMDEYKRAWADLMIVDQQFPKYVEWNDLTIMSVVIQYIEVVMLRYNTDGNLYLEGDEVWRAFDTFKGYLSVMAEQECRTFFKGEDFYKVIAEVEKVAHSMSLGRPDWVWRLIEERRWRDCEIVGDALSQGIFTFMIKEGRRPVGLDLVKAAAYSLRKSKLRVDRTQLLKIFGALMRALPAAGKAPPLKSATAKL